MQREGISSYAARNGLELVDIVEFHESAKDSEHRTQFHALLGRASAEQLDVVVWMWDRATRNLTDQERIEKLVMAGLFNLHVASEQRVLSKDSADSDWMVADFNAVSSKQYLRVLTTRVNDAMGAKAAGGWFPAKPPLGYINQKEIGPNGQPKDRGGTIALTDWGRRLIGRMGELRLQNFSLKEVGACLLSERLVPDIHTTKFRGPRSGAALIDAILKNPFYMGRFCWQGVWYDGKHEPVFTQQQWDSIQQVGKRTTYRSHKREGLFSGPGMRLTCAKCGCVVTYAPKYKGDREYRFYHCANGKGAHDVQVNVKEEAILEALGESVLESVYVPPERADELCRSLNQAHYVAQALKDQEAARCRSQLADLDVKGDRLCDHLTAGVLDVETFRRQQSRLGDERRDLFDRLQVAQRQIDGAYLVTAQRVLELAKNVRNQWETLSCEQKRDLLAELLENPQLDGTTVRYDLKKPFLVLSEMRESEEWRAREDSNFWPLDS